MKIQVITKLACDFCEKSQDDVEQIVAGPRSVAICNECVELCNGVIAKDRAKAVEPDPAPHESTMTFTGLDGIHKVTHPPKVTV